jgi:hypothetical protein
MFFLGRNQISIVISGHLPDLGSGGACFDIWWLIESLKGGAFHLRVVLMVNFLST